MAHGQHPAAAVGAEQDTHRAEAPAEGSVPQDEAHHGCGGEEGKQENRGERRHAVQVNPRHQHLDESVQRHDQDPGLQPRGQRTLWDAEPPTDPLGDIRHQLQRADRAPHPSQHYRRQHHGRPPQTPDDELYQVGLGEQLVRHALGRGQAPRHDREGHEDHEHRRLEDVRESAPAHQCAHRPEPEQVEGERVHQCFSPNFSFSARPDTYAKTVPGTHSSHKDPW